MNENEIVNENIQRVFNNKPLTEPLAVLNRKYNFKAKLRGIEYRVRNKETKRDKHLKRKFNLTLQEYNKILKKQGGVCAICRNKESNKSLAVDHNHKNGKVRGLLCTNCNITLGTAKEDIKILFDCIKYLKFHNKAKEVLE